MTSLEMQRDAKAIFSVLIADRDIELAEPVRGPWHPVRIESLRRQHRIQDHGSCRSRRTARFHGHPRRYHRQHPNRSMKPGRSGSNATRGSMSSKPRRKSSSIWSRSPRDGRSTRLLPNNATPSERPDAGSVRSLRVTRNASAAARAKTVDRSSTYDWSSHRLFRFPGSRQRRRWTSQRSRRRPITSRAFAARGISALSRLARRSRC